MSKDRWRRLSAGAPQGLEEQATVVQLKLAKQKWGFVRGIREHLSESKNQITEPRESQ